MFQVTTDWTQNGGTGCTESHSGTSAAAPIASSLIGLMLQARPCLTWRDVQYIIAVSAAKVSSRHYTCAFVQMGKRVFAALAQFLILGLNLKQGLTQVVFLDESST